MIISRKQMYIECDSLFTSAIQNVNQLVQIPSEFENSCKGIQRQISEIGTHISNAIKESSNERESLVKTLVEVNTKQSTLQKQIDSDDKKISQLQRQVDNDARNYRRISHIQEIEEANSMKLEEEREKLRILVKEKTFLSEYSDLLDSKNKSLGKKITELGNCEEKLKLIFTSILLNVNTNDFSLLCDVPEVLSEAISSFSNSCIKLKKMMNSVEIVDTQEIEGVDLRINDLIQSQKINL